MEPSIDYDQPDLIPAAERAISLVDQTVKARVHGPMDGWPIVGTVIDWGYENDSVVVWVDGPAGPEAVYQHDVRPV